MLENQVGGIKKVSGSKKGKQFVSNTQKAKVHLKH